MMEWNLTTGDGTRVWRVAALSVGPHQRFVS